MTTQALLFTDVVDSTLLVERLGDAQAAVLWAAHDRCARDLLASHAGREIDRTDGFFLLFDTVIDAARFALAYHAALAPLEIVARVGIHVGEVTLRENTAADVARGAKLVEVEGLAKPFAARVMALAAGAQTLLSTGARDALTDAAIEGVAIESHGHYRLKGVDAPAELFELGLAGASAFAPPPDADKAYRVVRSGDFWLPLREVRHNLAAERDAFVGRTNELRRLAQRLDADARLLTVLGPGGTGKTRFVTHYGWTWLGDWPGGVYFCDLSDARSLDGVVSAVAVALGVPLGKADPVVQLGHAIAARGRCLMILDNFEQVAQHAGATLGAWLDRAAEASFVVTSRERLHLAGEVVFAVEPLPLANDAIELFAARARAQRAGFVVDAANRAAVAEVVRLLDGLPLAIELAAARIGVLSPAQLVERMRDRFKLLAGARGHAARQATLRAAIDWSWDLLAPWEQAALAQCSVFEGGFTLTAAEAVLDLSHWPEAPPPMDAVQALVDKSFVRSWAQADAARFDIDEPHFGMYLSIHEYAAERLGASGGADAGNAQARHGRHFAGFGDDTALDALYRHGGVGRRHALALELGNLVVACRRALAAGQGEIAVATFRAAWEVLELQGPFSLGVVLGGEVLALEALAPSLRAAAGVVCAMALRMTGRVAETGALLTQAAEWAREAGDPRRASAVLISQGLLSSFQGRRAEAGEQLEAALTAARRSGNRRDEGALLGNLGNLYSDSGRMDEAREHYEASLVVHREIGNRRAEGNVLGNLGILHFEQGRMEDARAHYEASLAIHREVGNQSVAGVVTGNLGVLHYEQGRLEEALQFYQQALAIHREVGSRGFEALALDNLGVLVDELGRKDEARTLYEQALAIDREIGNRRSEVAVLCNLGVLHLDQGRVAESRAHYERALVIARELGSPRLEGAVLGGLGELTGRQGNVGAAREALGKAESLLKEVGDTLELAKLLCTRGHVEIAAGDFEAARSLLARAQADAVTLGVGSHSELRRELAKLQQALR